MNIYKDSNLSNFLVQFNMWMLNLSENYVRKKIKKMRNKYEKIDPNILIFNFGSTVYCKYNKSILFF